MTQPARTRLAALLIATLSLHAAAGEASAERARNLATVTRTLRERQAQHADSGEIQVARGIIADRQAGTVRLQAEATGLKGGAIAEFLIVTEHSSHDYEAATVAFASAGDLCRALEFIGIPRGLGSDAAALRLWPRGERVMATVREADAPSGAAVPLEHLVRDGTLDAPLPAVGLIYCGSVWQRDDDGEAFCVADRGEPGSIASTYNETYTVLDVPRQANQNDVYQRYGANGEHLFPAGTLLEILLIPEPRPDATPRVLPVTLHLEPGPGNSVQGRIASDPAPQPPPETLPDALRWLRRQTEAGRDPYVTLDWSGDLSLSQAQAVARVLDPIQGEQGIRLEPPQEGQLFYRALLPAEKWRLRSGRPAQPCELRFTREEDQLRVTLVEITETWLEGQLDPRLATRDIAIASPGELVQALAAQTRQLPVILLFAPGDLPLGKIADFLRPIQKTHGTVYAFVE